MTQSGPFGTSRRRYDIEEQAPHLQRFSRLVSFRQSLFYEFSNVYLQSTRQFDKFNIRHPTNLGFDLRESLSANIPPEQIELCHKHRLSKTLTLPQASNDGTSNVTRFFQVLNSELDCRLYCPFNGSEFGTERQKQTGRTSLRFLTSSKREFANYL